jgi:FKBP-type peptidyl-prolyl cis-trans isomerase 2
MLMSQGPDGRPIPIRVHEVKEKTVVVDLNHRWREKLSTST